jgi:hypothetical protein
MIEPEKRGEVWVLRLLKVTLPGTGAVSDSVGT